MKAITRLKYGGPEVLKIDEIATPVPKDDEVLIRVYSTTLNRTDCSILTGKPFLIRFFSGIFSPTSIVPGTDFAGEISRLGSKVRDFNIGDRVWGFQDQGLASHAEYMSIKTSRAISRIPDGISYDEAVCAGEGAHYAFNVLNKVQLNPEDNVLVNGATGAIGSACLQLLKAKDHFVAAVGNTKNMDLLASLGADRLFNYEDEDFTKSEKDAYTLIIDAVGKSSFAQCKSLLTPKGVYISSELGPGAENLYLPMITKIKGKKRVIFPVPSNCKRTVLYMNKLLEQGKYKAIIDRSYAPESVQDAYEYVMSGQKTGNVIINF